MKRRFAFAIASVFVFLGASLAVRPVTAAPLQHPMGNFTINHYSALTIQQDRVDILYVLDMAEIPAYQELGTIRADHDTNLTPAEHDKYVANKAADLMNNLSFFINNRQAALTMVGKPVLSFPPGAGGLPTLRLEVSLVAPLAGLENGSLEYYDDNYKERIGWKEIIAIAASGVTLNKSTVPTTDMSDALHKYPADLINNPPRVSSASLEFTSSISTGVVPAAVKRAQAAQTDVFGLLTWIQQQTNAVTAIVYEKDLPLGALLVALLVAFGIGAAHALSPGHGKTVVAAYLVGSKGTPAHAILLGLTVTVSHTFGVFLLGLVILYAANFILPETLYPVLGFSSGMLIVIMGITLFVQRFRAWKRVQKAQASSSQGIHEHSHKESTETSHEAGEVAHSRSDGEADSHGRDEHVHNHDHDHDHSHTHGHEHNDVDASTPHKHGPFGRNHTHLPTDGQQVTLWNLLALGIMGGIIPCPSALVVLMVAVASHKIALGLLLILTFSLGLAVVLTVIGLLMVYSRNMLSRKVNFNNGLLLRLPMLSALAVSGLGLVIAIGALNIR